MRIPVASGSRPLVAALAVASALATAPAPARAQTDFYNTDLNRPVLIEDAYPTERYAFELKLAPVTLERERGGVYNWAVEPELAYGILPRTHVEVGFPISFRDAGGGSGLDDAGLAGIDLSVLHNLNAETSALPAFGIRGDLLLPVGRFGPDRTYASVKGIATRTYRWARFHVNGQYTFGPDAADSDPAAQELGRWTAGVAVDRTFPLKSMLLTADVFARQPLGGDDLQWNAGAGIRYQLSPRLAIDGGLGKRLTGADHSWFVTFGTAYAFSVRSLIPTAGR